MNILLILVTTIVCLPMLVYAFEFSLPEALALAVLCISCILFVPSYGLLINLNFPTMDGSNDTLIVKQSKAATIAIFGSMAIMGVGAILYVLAKGFLSDVQYIVICAVILGAVGFIMLMHICRKGEGYLLRL